MAFQPSFQINQIITNDELREEFKCSSMGTMRRSKTINSLIIISDNTLGTYKEKWIDGILYHTGMGRKGDQDINFSQNATLAHSNSSGITLYLFEIFIPCQYIYRGPVILAAPPYQETQKDIEGNPRKAWIFPIKPVSKLPPIDAAILNEYETSRKKQAQSLSDKDLIIKAIDHQSDIIPKLQSVAETYRMSQAIAEFSLRVARGHCQLCNSQAPFKDNQGKPYLEPHHIQKISEGGLDTIENTVALCPNCHAKMHVLNKESDVEFLIRRNRIITNSLN